MNIKAEGGSFEFRLRILNDFLNVDPRIKVVGGSSHESVAVNDILSGHDVFRLKEIYELMIF